jgi:hypothetical protein
MERDGDFECRMSGFLGSGRAKVDQDDSQVLCSTLIAFSMLGLGDGDGVDGGEDIIPCQGYYMRDRKSKSLSLHRRCRVPGLGPVCLSVACWESSL